MRPVRKLLIPLGALIFVSTGCVPVQPPVAAAGAAVEVAGWYMQNANSATLQPCAAERLDVSNGGELRKRAKAFGLQDDLPVYVRVKGVRDQDGFVLAGVEQFGSRVPIRDCPMSGTTIQR